MLLVNQKPLNSIRRIPKMNALSSDFLAAAMAATPARLTDALAVLKGDEHLAQPTKPVAHEPFVTLEALSKITGIGRITLWRYNVPGHRHAGRIRYRASEVLAFLESPKFQTVVAALKANGWRRPTVAEIARFEQEHSLTGADSPSVGGGK
jgi:predicted DNA-binding transcriptional regulator AlpA